jgi:IS30 family transposase
MNYIVTIKDHFTGFVILDCIPRKTPSMVAGVLNKWFGSYGYPTILHTDNGKEFTGKKLINEMRKNAPSMVTVTGRVRTPRDQGSVENMNKLVKTALWNIHGNYCDQNVVPNWPDNLGQVMNSLNGARQKGLFKGTSSYEVVFGIAPHHFKLFEIEANVNSSI